MGKMMSFVSNSTYKIRKQTTFVIIFKQLQIYFFSHHQKVFIKQLISN